MTRSFLAGALCIALSTAVAGQMPDLAQMSGTPLLSGDLSPGTVTVRVVRGDMSNNVANQPVDLHGAGPVQTVQTGADGRATFSGLPQNARVHVVSTLDGARLESSEFAVPVQGGIRIMLVGRAQPGAPNSAEAPASQAAPSPAAVPGTIALNSQSRFVVEVGEETVDFYALLDVVNAGASPIQTDKPLVIEPPPGAGDVTVLEGSSPQAKADGGRLIVSPPFAPGTTALRFAYQLPSTSGQVTIRQVLPLALPQTSLLVKKMPEMTLASPQVTDQREAVLEGQTYFVAEGPAIASGGVLEITLAGLPHHSTAPRWIALGLALMIVIAGLWYSRGAATTREAERQALEARREQLYAELVRLEAQHAEGRDGSRRSHRRHVIIDHLREVHMRLEDLADDLPPEGLREPAVDRSLRAHRA